jgi:hypothetical protein
MEHRAGLSSARNELATVEREIRKLVQPIKDGVFRLCRDGDQPKITLKGDLAGMLSATTDSKRSPDPGDLMVQIKLVAAAGFEPATFGL